MKPQLLLLFISLTVNHAKAQEFAPIGATWYYGEAFAFDPLIDYVVVTATKDTAINGIDCVEIDAANFCLLPNHQQYVSTRNDSVFLFDPDLNDFKLIYDFRAPPGASWSIPMVGWEGYIDTVMVIVDAVSTISVNAHELGVQYVSYHCLDYNEFGLFNSYYYSSTIVDLLGDLDFLFNVPIELSTICDGNYSQGLRCYDDDYIGHYETGKVPYCEYTSTGIHEININSLGIFPNPTRQNIYLTTVPSQIQSIVLIDNLGKIIREFNSPGEIHLDGLNSGMYILRIINDKNEYYLEKVIKYDN